MIDLLGGLSTKELSLLKIKSEKNLRLKLDLDSRGNIKANETDYKTSLNKIFVAGDSRRGQSLVVWAIREGRQCAYSIDKFLMGTSNLQK